MSLASARAAQAKKPKTPKPPKPKRPPSPKPTDGTKRPTGRPPIPFTEELVDELCTRIACREQMSAIFNDPMMPGQDTFYRWMHEKPGFFEKVARARELRGQARVARADDLVADVLDGKIDPSAGRVAILHEQWAAGREAPKVYGDRLDVTSDSKPLQVVDAAAAIQALLAALPTLAALPAPTVIEAEAVPATAQDGQP